MSNLLIIILFLLIFTVLILLFVEDDKIVRGFSISMTSFVFVLSLFLWVCFDRCTSKFQYMFVCGWLNNININFIFGIDGISLFFIILTTFLVPVCLLISFQSIKKNVKYYTILFLLLEFFLLIVFSILDLFIFYIFFESVLIPMFLIIGLWGSRERKIRAAYLFFFYTLIGSLFMLLSIIHIHVTYGTTDYQSLLYIGIDPFFQKVYWLSFFFSFAAKVPMLPFHIWLPEAHVEAPTAGSVILAGILLKLGSYGFLRFSLPLFAKATIYFTPLVYSLSVIAVIFTSLNAIRQTDMKRIIAYASVAHMNMILIGMFSITLQGLEGSLLQMISHGIVSSALFLSVGVLYDRYHNRLITYYSGLTHVMPIFSLFFLVYIFANIAIPGTSSFIGEFLILLGIYQKSTIITFLSASSMVLGGIYSLWLYNRVCFGNVSTKHIKVYFDLTYYEILIHIPFVVMILLFGVFPNILLDCVHTTVYNLIIQFEYNLI